MQTKETEMPSKLSEKEKSLRGTNQRCRRREPRPVSVVRREMREVRKLIADQTFNVELARKSIRAEGCLVEVTILDSHGKLGKCSCYATKKKQQHRSSGLQIQMNSQFKGNGTTASALPITRTLKVSTM
jgi:hypothetical protein